MLVDQEHTDDKYCRNVIWCPGYNLQNLLKIFLTYLSLSFRCVIWLLSLSRKLSVDTNCLPSLFTTHLTHTAKRGKMNG